ncbi:hypothetical protein HPP92_021764 [Vanilla planifolia]|uniref:Peptide N-acetyl-beta-D-glucosaminyl asparaginase amidase A N-terminal domain-containing protein n=1 Tax=Vanilla planifolia TaxID=51239 RepID=A0A835UH51_VANPL|nr:hypothetical protein HPP92_021764 [Vanilla planifolia]
MANFVLSLSSFLLLVSAINPTAAILHRHLNLTFFNEFAASLSSHQSSFPPSPTTYFEVRRPIPVPNSLPCSTLVLQHDFASTYGRPPITSVYTPPSHCPDLLLRSPSRIVLEWSAASAGLQFDRIFSVWLSGVDLLRSCTAEPRATGILWTIRKDVTRYASLFSKPQTLAVYMGNIVDETYTGIYHVNVSFHFYFDHRQSTPPAVQAFVAPADLIIPISKNLPLSDGAVLEVYLSFHSSDEFWYTNPPNSYISDNNLTGSVSGNGAFREVTVRLDGVVVGAIWPFTVIYTGGFNPLLWRPISGIGSFDLPSYNIEITPFLGKIIDGKNHSFGFGVTNALDVWFIDANLYLWLDGKSSFTAASLLKFESPEFAPSVKSKFKGLDGHFNTRASRTISSTGWVKSSYGNITTHFSQKLDYSNKMKFTEDGNTQEVKQILNYNHGSYSKCETSVLYAEQIFKNFPLYLYSRTANQDNGSFSSIADLRLGFNEKKFSKEASGFSFSSLKNSQSGHGVMRVGGGRVTSGIASTKQLYRYESNEGCYFRDIGSKNYSLLYDESSELCEKT